MPVHVRLRVTECVNESKKKKFKTTFEHMWLEISAFRGVPTVRQD